MVDSVSLIYSELWWLQIPEFALFLKKPCTGWTGFVQSHTGHTKSYLVILLKKVIQKVIQSQTFWIFFLESPTFHIFPDVSTYSTVELGKLKVIPSGIKFSQLFNGVTCYFVSVEEKKAVVGNITYNAFFQKKILIAVFAQYL